jgi:mannosyl-oligosaccharide alpha-1,2-mannosidase
LLILVVSGFFGDSTNPNKEKTVKSDGTGAVDHGRNVDEGENDHHHDDDHHEHEDGHHHDKKPLLTDNVDDFDESPETRMKRRREAVREMFKYAYGGYENKCFSGAEELKPVTGACHNWLIKGYPLTTLDSLDTIILMNETGYYERARRYISEVLNWDQSHSVCFFETTIRYVGGLLSAYELTGDKLFLDKARDLADRLLPAFNTNTGIPKSHINLKTGALSSHQWTGYASILSEVGSLQLEFAYLSHHTGNPVYAQKALGVFDKIIQIMPANKLYPIWINPDDATFRNDLITLGGGGDSFYEYLLKYWLLTSQTSRYGKVYYELVDAILDHLAVKMSSDNDYELWYIAEMNGSQLDHKFSHLACFFWWNFSTWSTIH